MLDSNTLADALEISRHDLTKVSYISLCLYFVCQVLQRGGGVVDVLMIPGEIEISVGIRSDTLFIVDAVPAFTIAPLQTNTYCLISLKGALQLERVQ